MLDQGFTFFVISWKNPDASMEDIGFDDYLEFGPLAAMRVVKEITGSDDVNAIGYCIGGTLLGMVDNEVWVRGALSEILIADGYVVSQASNGVTGLRLVLVEPPDVILLNLALPEMDGGALLCELRSHPTTVRIPVLVLLDPCDVARRAEYPGTHGVVCRRVCATEVLAQIRQSNPIGWCAGQRHSAQWRHPPQEGSYAVDES